MFPARTSCVPLQLAAKAGALPTTLKLAATLADSGQVSKAGGARSFPKTKRKDLKEEVGWSVDGFVGSEAVGWWGSWLVGWFVAVVGLLVGVTGGWRSAVRTRF